MSETYTIKELQALPDADLNALAAELRGVTCHLCEMGHRLSNDDQLHLPSQSIGMIEVQPCKMAQFTPATDRNQSGELLEWAAETQNIIFTIAFHPEGASRGFIWYGLHRKPYESVQGNTARAETVAFCAAMLAMAGRLQ